jgi:hypothetical protein
MSKMGLISNIGNAIKTGVQNVSAAVKNVFTSKTTPSTSTTTPSTSASPKPSTSTSSATPTTSVISSFTQKPYTAGTSSAGTSSAGTSSAGTSVFTQKPYSGGTSSSGSSSSKSSSSQGMSSASLPGTGTGYYTSGGTWIDTGAQFGVTTQTGVSVPKSTTSIFTEPYYSISNTTKQTVPLIEKPTVVPTVGLPSLARYGQSTFWNTDEKVTTPRLSGLGIPTTPRIPGDTRSTSEQAPGTVMTKYGGVSTAFPEQYTTTGGTVSEIFGGKIYGIEPKGKPLPLVSGEQSFSGRIDPNLGITQVEDLSASIDKDLETYNELITTELNPSTTKIIKDATIGLNTKSIELDNVKNDLINRDLQFTQRLERLNRNSQVDVDRFNTDLDKYLRDVDIYNSKVDTFQTDYNLYNPIIERYNIKANEATQLASGINTKVTMANDIRSNIDLSLVPEALKAETVKRYGPGGIFENKFLSWEGQAERLKNVGGVYKIGLTGKGEVDVNPEAVHNPFIRDVLKIVAEHPLETAAIGAGVVGAGGIAAGLGKTAVYGLTASTLFGEGYGTLAESGKVGGLTGVREPLFNSKYTQAMDREARAVMMSTIPRATIVPRKDLPGSVWKPGAALGEGINLGFMSEDRLQQGINALGDYYKQQGLSDSEANYRILKAQESLAISNQREIAELVAAGVVTNIVGAKGVTWAEKVVAPKITGTSLAGKATSKILTTTSKIPLLPGFLKKRFGEAGTAEGLRYLTTRTLGMAPAGALEAVYFTGAQQGLRYNQEMTPKQYWTAAAIGAASAPLAQMFIEKNFPTTIYGGVERPQVVIRGYNPKTGWKMNVAGKPLNLPNLREVGLFSVDPLEPISDAFTQFGEGALQSAKGIRVAPLVFTNVNTNTQPIDASYNVVSEGFSTSPNTQIMPYSTNTEIAPYTYASTKTSPLVVSSTRVPTPLMSTNADLFTYSANTRVSPYVQSQMPTLTDTLPYINTDVVPYTNVNAMVNVNPNVNTNVNPEVTVQPYVYPEVNTNINPFVANKFPPMVGWQGSLGESQLGEHVGRKYKEWIIGNKIATYGEDWMAQQQQKAINLENAIKGQQQLRLAGQGVAVVNRIIPRQQVRMPQMQQQQFRMPQMPQPQLYTTIPRINEYGVVHKSEITPKQRAQLAVERGFGPIKPLTTEKIRGTHKVLGKHKIMGWM